MSKTKPKFEFTAEELEVLSYFKPVSRAKVEALLTMQKELIAKLERDVEKLQVEK